MAAVVVDLAAIANGASPAGKFLFSTQGPHAGQGPAVFPVHLGLRTAFAALRRLVELRYLGFDQKLNTRTYKFKGIANGEPTLYFMVTADLGLFLSHRVGIQEGPALCAHKLASDLLTPADGNHELTNEDLTAHVSARALADTRKTGTRRSARQV